MCVVEQRTYLQPDGRRETFDHVKSRCPFAGAAKTCRYVTYERTMQGTGHSYLSPPTRYADESASPATESFPPTPVDGATVVEVTPTSAGLPQHPSPKHRKTGSLGQIVFKFGSNKEKEKAKQKDTSRSRTKTKRYHGSSAVSEATSSSSIRSYSPAPPSPLSATQEKMPSQVYQFSHRRSQSATMPSKPSLAYATTTARATRPSGSREREELHLLSPQTHADPPFARPLAQADAPTGPPGPPGPPRPPAPPAPADPPSPDKPSHKRSRRPPPIVTQPSTSSDRRPTAAASRPPNHTARDTNPNRDASQIASDREFAERLSASLSRLSADGGHTPHETEDERQARIERERATGREQLRRERQADEYWAQYHRDRQERREENRRMNEQRREVDDWEASLEEGRRRVEQDRANRQPEERHDPSVDASAPADSSGDEDWQAALENGRRRLAELRRTNEAAVSDARPTFEPAANEPLRRRNTTGNGHRHSQHYRPRVPPDTSSTSRSNSSANATASSSIGADTAADHESAERDRLLAFEREQSRRERQESDARLASEIADAQAEVDRANARLASRREQGPFGRSNYGLYAHHDRAAGLAAASPPSSDFYNPRAGMRELRHERRDLAAMIPEVPASLGEPGWERGQRVINEVRGGRRSRRSSVSYHQYPHHRWD